MSFKTIYVYHDRFQPPHLGNKIVWDALKSKYGQENCFISANDDNDPLNFKEKQSIFAAMGIESSNIVKSNKEFGQIQIPSGFDPSKAVVVWIVQKDNITKIPSNIKPYTKTPKLGESYYSLLPDFCAKYANGEKMNLIGTTETNDDIINFLGKNVQNTESEAESFKKIFGFFDESLYKMLTEKFKTKVENKSVINRILENYSKKSTESDRAVLAKKIGVSVDSLNLLINRK